MRRNGRDAPEAVVGTDRARKRGFALKQSFSGTCGCWPGCLARRGEIDQLSMLYVVAFLSPGEPA
jgi:hypothetical protein